MLFCNPKWSISPFSLTKLVAYYESKTHGILERYLSGLRADRVSKAGSQLTRCWSELDLNFRDPSSLRWIFDRRAGSVMGAGLGIPRKPEVTVV